MHAIRFIFYCVLWDCIIIIHSYPYRLPERNHTTSLSGLEFLPPYYSNYGIGQNKDVALRCKVRTSAEQSPTFMWEKMSNTNTENFNLISEGAKYLIRQKKWTRDIYNRGRYISKLVIKQTETSDSGLYRCRVTITEEVSLQRLFEVYVNESSVTPVRLVTSTTHGEGLIEVFHKHKWGAICVSGFTTIEAAVICRSLGYPHGGQPWNAYADKLIFRRPHRYGNPFWMNNAHCSLNATDISHCSGWGDNVECEVSSLDFYVGVTCRQEPLQVPVSLIQLSQHLPEGTVEVFHNGQIGRICDHGVGHREVNVLCKMLGHNFGGFKFNPDVRHTFFRELIQNLRCPENGTHLDQCSHEAWGEQCTSCQCDGYHSLVAVRCWTKAEKENSNASLRLAASNVEHEGRIEVKHNNTWGTVTPRSFGSEEADVVCRMLGYRYGGTPKLDTFPPGQGPIWIDEIHCPFTANDLSDCEFRWGPHFSFFDHKDDVGVKCRTEPEPEPAIKVRLIGPLSTEGEGRLEYFKHGHWGTVCKAYMGTSEASAFCFLLGYRNGGYILQNRDNSDAYRFYGPPWIEYLDCPWNTTDIETCLTRNWAYKDFRKTCDAHTHDAALKCRTDEYPEYEVKLIGGSLNEGQLRIEYNNSWYSVCSLRNNWRDVRATTAAVVCRQLGYMNGGEYRFITIDQPDLWIGLDCNGKEMNVGQCNYFMTDTYCGPIGYSNAVYIKCHEVDDVDRQMSTYIEDDGRALIHRNGISWEICSNTWGDIEADAFCRMLVNSGGVETYLPYGRVPPRSGVYNVISNMFCPRGTHHLGDCFYGPTHGDGNHFYNPWEPSICKATGEYRAQRIVVGGVSCS
ncbi:scavenger receptor cysteine-rich domain superfamily protein-like [Mytilus galloprovincialis]|uniref:scavenger receptor cysteine-rich domain superfamily protein-like n=1 Tax=Mytilus galloprovincialis TaxID=29158 RepID=UPI003F7C412A